MSSKNRIVLSLAVLFLIASFFSIVHAQTSAPANNESNSLTSDGTPMIMTVEDSFTGAKYEFTVNSTSQAVDIMNGIISTSQSAGSALTEPLKKTFNAAVTELGVKPIVSGAKAQITGLFDSVKQLSQKIQKPVTLGMKLGPYSIQFTPLHLGGNE